MARTRRQRRAWAIAQRMKERPVEGDDTSEVNVEPESSIDSLSPEEEAEFLRHAIVVDGKHVDDRPPKQLPPGKDAPVKYTGRAADIKMICGAITRGWQIPERTLSRVISACQTAIMQPNVAPETITRVGNMLARLMTMKLHAARLDMAAEIAGLHASEVQAGNAKPDIGNLGDIYYRKMIDACTTLEELEAVKNVFDRVK